MKYRLGIDLGSTSLGWCTVKLDENNHPINVLDMGVRIFPDGRGAKTKQPLAVIRREKRSARRRRDRYLERRNLLIQALVKYDLMPKDYRQRRKLEHLDPWMCRAAAAESKVVPEYIGRALFHINQRRGFRSNRIAESEGDAELSGMKGGIAQLEKKLEGKTLGQYLFAKHINKDTVRLRPRALGSKNEWDFYVSRDMVAKEIDIIFKTQEKYYPGILTTEVQKELKSIIIEQRPLKIPDPGWCTLLKAERRGRLAYPEIQQFRILQEVNNLNLKKFSPADPDLTQDQRQKIIQELTSNFSFVNKQGLLTWAKIIKLLELNRASKFNLDELGRKGLKCDHTSFVLSQKEYFGEQWWQFSFEEKNNLIDKLATVQNKSVLEQWLVETYGLSQKNVQKIITLRLVQGYGNISLAAARKLNPFMRDGSTYDKACIATGINHSEFHTGEIYEKGDLPYYGELLSRYAIGGDTSFDPKKEPEKHYGKITNPTVHLALNQLRIVVNALIERYGCGPHDIHIELARELPLGEKQLSRLKSDIKNGRKNNERIDAELEKLGVTKNYANRMKFKLWEDLAESPIERCCPFTGKVISLSELFTDQFEVEHLLPFSLSYDDSRANKVISHRNANRLKGNQSPYEAFGHSPEGYSWDDIVARVENFANPHKKWRFQSDAWEKWKGEHGDVIARMLNDTRYMTRVAREYMSYVCHKDNVVAITGQLTALLRHHWGLNKLLSEQGIKERGDHRHHAVDALVVACTSRASLQNVSKAARKAQNAPRLIESLETPFPEFEFEKLKQKFDSMVVSYKLDHGHPKPGKTIAGLHEETYYGRLGNGSKKGTGLYATRKPFMKVEANEKKINEIANPAIKQDLLDKLIEKPSKKEWQQFLEEYAQEHNVRRVRVHIEKSDSVMIPIKDKTGKPYRYVQGGSNYCADIWCTDKGKKSGKWQAEIISMFYAHQLGFMPKWRKDNPTAWRVMRLQINDSVALEQEGVVQYLRVKKISMDGRVWLRQLNIAKEEGDKLSVGASASTLQKMNARKIYVSPIGDVKDPGHARKSKVLA